MLGFAALAAFALACGSSGSDKRGPGVDTSSGGSTDNKSKEHTVVFEVGGTIPKSNNITYGIGSQISQDNGAAVPWKKESKTTDSVIITSLSAQSSETSGDVTCKITIDGKVISENKSTGQYAVVSCSGNG
jgi:hypothetical protein